MKIVLLALLACGFVVSLRPVLREWPVLRTMPLGLLQRLTRLAFWLLFLAGVASGIQALNVLAVACLLVSWVLGPMSFRRERHKALDQIERWEKEARIDERELRRIPLSQDRALVVTAEAGQEGEHARVGICEAGEERFSYPAGRLPSLLTQRSTTLLGGRHFVFAASARLCLLDTEELRVDWGFHEPQSTADEYAALDVDPSGRNLLILTVTEFPAFEFEVYDFERKRLVVLEADEFIDMDIEDVGWDRGRDGIRFRNRVTGSQQVAAIDWQRNRLSVSRDTDRAGPELHL